MTMNINWKLPEDIVKVIFSKLAFSNLPNCRIVCKAWNHVVLDYASKFHIPNAFHVYTSDIPIQPLNYGHMQHLNPKMSCIDFDTASSVATITFDRHCKAVHINTSCNGLLHIHKEMFVDIWCNGIWNPMTNEFFKIPRSELDEDIYFYGFGFNPETKVISSTIEVWRFGISNQWEHLGCQPFKIADHGTYIDGVIYWFGYDITNVSVIYAYALDVETETFEIDILDLGPYSFAEFQPFNSIICLIVLHPHEVEVWIMRAKHSWIREFVLKLPMVGLYRVDHIRVFEDKGSIYILVNNDLFCFDKNGKKIKMKTLFNPNDTKIKNIVHIEAFHFGSLPKILSGND